MKELLHDLPFERVQQASIAASDLFTWVHSVYAQSLFNQSSLSNLAFLSKGLQHVPYSALRKYQPPNHDVVPPY